MELSETYIWLGAFFGFFMACGLGANDVSNAMGTSVGSRAITLRQAILIAMVFEFLGALLAGGEVTDTIRRGIIDSEIFLGQPDLLVQGMLSALLGTATWLVLASYFGWPVSTTHTIVGAIVGFGAVGVSVNAIQWEAMIPIGLAWVFSPCVGGVISYLLFTSVRKLILDHPRPFDRAKRVVPYYIFLTCYTTTGIGCYVGFLHFGIHQPFWVLQAIVIALALILTLLGVWALTFIKMDPQQDKAFHFASVEQVFTVLMIFTACAMAFAHGSNDVANAIGPLAAIVSIVESGNVLLTAQIPPWVLLLGAGGIVVGLLTYGHKVIATIGEGITELTPTRGFAATLSAALTVQLASGSGLPISTTHTLVGAVLGVGLARGIGALNLNVIRNIFMSWVITLPAGMVLSILSFQLLTAVL